MPTNMFDGNTENMGVSPWDIDQRDDAKYGRSVTAAVDTGRKSAANGLRWTASALRDSPFLRDSNATDRMGNNTADKLEAAAQYLDAHDCERMMADTKAMVTRNPGRSLITAAALGFFVAMIVKRNN